MPADVFTLSGVPPLITTVTVALVFETSTGRNRIWLPSLALTGKADVTTIAFAVPAPPLISGMTENGRSLIRTQLPVPLAPTFIYTPLLPSVVSATTHAILFAE
ncbi:hypothetical protein [Terrarubrum flagellatum]|uniref:hypothetical protein n=1 Tax=Terrirubrum flagellatum TaxID=2895980 RepID=UPI003144F3BB